MDINNLYFGLYKRSLIVYEPINSTYGHVVCVLFSPYAPSGQTYGDDKPVVLLPFGPESKLRIVALYEEVL